MEATLFYINKGFTIIVYLIGMFCDIHALNFFLNNTRLVCSLKLVGRLFQSCAAQGINVFFALPVLKFLMSLRRWTPTLSASCRVVRPGWITFF